jgi:hypothetical protein
LAPALAVGTRIPVGDAAVVAIRLRGASARFEERELAGTGHDARFHQMTLTGEYGTSALRGRIRVSGQLGAWTAGARDWEVWQEGLTAGPLLGAGLELPVVRGEAGSAGVSCSTQLLLGDAPAPLLVPCGVGGSIRMR